MVVNLLNLLDLSSPINNSYNGSFSTCDFFGRDNETNSINKVLLDKIKNMDNKQLIEKAKSVLNSKFKGDVDKFSDTIKIPSMQLYNFLIGGYNLPDDSRKSLESFIRSEKEDKIIIGDKIEGDKIAGNKEIIQGDQYNFNLCPETDSKEDIQSLKKKIKSMKRAINQLKEKK